MGKRIIAQRRGRGTSTYTSNSHRYLAKIRHRKYDSTEKQSVIKGKIVDLINCPGHSAPLALIKYENDDKLLVLAPENIRIDDEIESGFSAKPKYGNTLPLQNISEGTLIYNIETAPGDGGKLCRSSGTFARVLSKTKVGVIIELPSKKQRLFNSNCRASIGIIAGGGRTEKPWVKAGKRHHAMKARGKLYPRTSGVAMNAVDHPYGSGRGRQHSNIKPSSPHAPPGKKVGPVSSKRSGRKK